MTVPDTSTITIRPALGSEVGGIVDLAEAAYRGAGGWTTEAHLVSGTRTDSSEVHGMLTDPAVTLLVAVLTPTSGGDGDGDGEIVGCCYTRREPADDAGTTRAELGLFAVHPSAQSRGLGRRLLEAQSDLLQGAGVDVLMIRVLQSRPELHAWYERQGFVRTGVAVPFAGDPADLHVEGLGMDVMERPLQER